MMAGDQGTGLTSRNPSYERILLQLINEEDSIRKKSIYETCLNSLRLFPLPLESPVHCRVLEGFSRKIVRILENKLKECCPISPIIVEKAMSWDDPVELPPLSLSQSNSPAEKRRKSSDLSHSFEDVENVFAPVKRKKSKKASKQKINSNLDVLDVVLSQNLSGAKNDTKRKKRSSSSSNNCPVSSETNIESHIVHEIHSESSCEESSSQNNIESSDLLLNTTISQVRNKSSKEYVPKTGSGAYAVLMTLFKNSLDPSYIGYMTKDELISQGQRLSKESFTHSRGPQGRYTAWSGVSILVKKDLLKTWDRNPKKYNISNNGIDLARRISNVEGEEGSTCGLASISREISEIPTNIRSQSQTFEQASWLDELKDLKYCYVKDSSGKGQETNNQDHAEMDIDDGVYYLIKCRKVDIEGSLLKYRITKEIPNGLVLAFLHEADASDLSPIASSTDLLVVPSPIKSPVIIESKKKDISTKTKKKQNQVSLNVDNSNDDSDSILNEQVMDPQKDFRYWLKSDTSSSNNTNTDTHMDLDHENIHSDCVLSPNHYEIVLLVDTAEVQSSKPGGKSTRREITCDELSSNGVKFEKRNINVGDFLWIAKEKVEVNSHSFRQREPKELVLPYIVERKRMDDLQKSIMDQRYAEQKFRIKNSGLKYLYYLVEDFKSMDRNTTSGRGIGASALEQAMANTTIQEGFFIQRTKNQKESMELITTMTRNLIEKYSGKTLKSCRKEEICEGRVKHFESTLMNYKEFNELSRKNKNFTVKEVFMKMLLQLKGLTPGMALSIVHKYPTPLAMKNAYVGQNEKEIITGLQGLRYDGGKKIPINVSRPLGLFFSQESLE
ncbi:crossover junction endonuclease MUS81 [Lepeophtheirus salmonis]|nr:crossover junction endonuclease MUS81-like [Lepeophtheirus salmonis]